MSRRRNVTITLEEDVARWARVKAAEEDTSISQLVGEMLKERMLASKTYGRAMKRYLRRKELVDVSGLTISRDELHDRPGLR